MMIVREVPTRKRETKIVDGKGLVEMVVEPSEDDAVRASFFLLWPRRHRRVLALRVALHDRSGEAPIVHRRLLIVESEKPTKNR
jgi:hypothetical protein